MTERKDVPNTVFRDQGPYSTRNSSKGALIPEAGKMVEAIRVGVSIYDLRLKALDGFLFTQKSRNARERIWDALHHRYLVSKPEWVLSDLCAAHAKGLQSREFVSLLYLHYALRDHLTYDFVTEILWDRWGHRQLAVSREDVLFLLDQASKNQPQIRRWSENTRIKLAGSTLTALRDFGLLQGTQKKTLIQPVLTLATAEHLLRILTVEGVRGADVLSNATWRLFFCRVEEVAHVLSRLAQNQRIRFERVGNTVVLETPEEWNTER